MQTLPPDALERKKNAVDALKAGDLDSAGRLLEGLSNEYPKVPELRFNLALVLFKSNHFDEALEQVNAGLALEPNDEKAKAFKQAIEKCLAKQENKPPSIAPLRFDEQAGKRASQDFRNRSENPTAQALLQSRLDTPHVMIPSDRKPGEPSPLSTKAPKYSFSRLMNFVTFEHSRRQDAVRSRFVNNFLDDSFSEPFSSLMIENIDMEEDKPVLGENHISPPYNTRIEPPVKLSPDQVEEVIQKVENLPAVDDAESTTNAEPQNMEEIRHFKQLAHGLYEARRFNDAIKLCNAFLERVPEDLEMLFTVGFCYRDSGDLEDAEAAFKHILELYYDNAYAWNNLAIVYNKKHEEEHELFCLLKARDFGYKVDYPRLADLLSLCNPKDPFAEDTLEWDLK